jgi:hypothetical protein
MALSVSCEKKISTHVQPRARRRREVQFEPRVLLEPGLDIGVVVGGVVVEDQMDLKAFWGPRDHRPQELQELGVAVTGKALTDHRAGQDIQGGEQRRGAVALLVVGHRTRPPGLDRQARLSAIERLDLALLVHVQDNRVLRRVQIQANHVDKLFFEPRVV